MVLLDALNTFFITAHMSRSQLIKQGKELDEENINFFLHNFYNNFNSLIKEHGKMIVCWEGRKSTQWRQSIYPFYKANRDKMKGEDYYKNVVKTIPSIINILKYYPVKQLEVEFAEADDVIFSLSEHYHDKEEVLIISTDGDFGQIKNRFSTVKILNPITKKYATPSPYLIEEKCIVGDKSDNIPGISGIGKITFNKMLQDKVLFNKKMTRENIQIFETFKKIVDLSNFFPEKRKEIVDLEQKTNYNNFDRDEIELYYFTSGLKDLLSRWSSIREEITRKINEAN